MANANNYYPREYPCWEKTTKATPISCFSSYPLEEGPQENSILLIGGVHGDEPEGVTLAQATLRWLKSVNPKELKPWILIPCINPDGFAAGERTNSNGVDLNRNFPTRCWTAEYSKPRYYPGSSPGSELETQAIVRLVEAQKPSLIIHCHSFTPCVVYTGEAGKRYADRLAECSGYPCQATIGYDCPGSFGDFGCHEKDTPVICIEADHEAPLDIVWPRFKDGIQWIFKAENV